MTLINIVRSSNRGLSVTLTTTAKNKHKISRKKMDRKELLKKRDNTTSKETKIPLVLTYSWSLPNISKVVHKHCNILSVTKHSKRFFRINW